MCPDSIKPCSIGDHKMLAGAWWWVWIGVVAVASLRSRALGSVLPASALLAGAGGRSPASPHALDLGAEGGLGSLLTN